MKRLATLKRFLVPGWRKVWRHWSSRFIAAGLVVMAWPEFFLSLYSMVPSDIQEVLPSRTQVVIVCMVLALIAKVVNQHLEDDKDDDHRHRPKKRKPRRIDGRSGDRSGLPRPVKD